MPKKPYFSIVLKCKYHLGNALKYFLDKPRWIELAGGCGGKGISFGLEYTAQYMQEGETGRVSAENKAGFGEPSEASFEVIFKT